MTLDPKKHDAYFVVYNPNGETDVSQGRSIFVFIRCILCYLVKCCFRSRHLEKNLTPMQMRMFLMKRSFQNLML